MPAGICMKNFFKWILKSMHFKQSNSNITSVHCSSKIKTLQQHVDFFFFCHQVTKMKCGRRIWGTDGIGEGNKGTRDCVDGLQLSSDGPMPSSAPTHTADIKPQKRSVQILEWKWFSPLSFYSLSYVQWHKELWGSLCAPFARPQPLHQIHTPYFY